MVSSCYNVIQGSKGTIKQIAAFLDIFLQQQGVIVIIHPFIFLESNDLTKWLLYVTWTMLIFIALRVCYKEWFLSFNELQAKSQLTGVNSVSYTLLELHNECMKTHLGSENKKLLEQGSMVLHTSGISHLSWNICKATDWEYHNDQQLLS